MADTEMAGADRAKRREPVTVLDLDSAAGRAWPAVSMDRYDQALERLGATAVLARPTYAGLHTALAEGCALAGFAVGHVYLELPGTGHLLPAHLWEIREPVRAGAFVRATMGALLAPGVGLPGQAAAAGRPVAIPHLHDDLPLPRARAAVAVGLRSAYAFPIRRAGGLGVVLEFLALEPRVADPHVEALLAGLVAVLNPMLAGPDAQELLAHELALARAVELDGLQRVGAIPALEAVLLG